MTPERTLAADLRRVIGGRVRVCGWVESCREDDGRQVVTLRDKSGTATLVAAVSAGVEPEAAVEAVGTVEGDGGGTALIVDDLRVVGPVLAPLPVGEESSLEERLNWRFLDLRRPRNRFILEVQTTVERAMREYWADHGFLELHSPKIRPTPNKSGRELFTITYFDRKAYLAQSPQFYKQMAMASGLDRVFEIGPVFRANPLITSRHDTEFTSVDVEMSWIGSHLDLLAFEEDWLRHVIEQVAASHREEIARAFGGVEVVVPRLPFPRMTLEEARAVAGRAGFPQPPGDLDAAGEKAVGAHVRREHGHQFVFVTEYPASTRPFYHMRLDEDSPNTRSFDLLWNGMEVTTGAQREHRRERLVRQAEEGGVPTSSIRWYLDFFTYGCPPHGGFGLGLTRTLMCLLGVDDVREVTFLHRGPDRLMP